MTAILICDADESVHWGFWEGYVPSVWTIIVNDDKAKSFKKIWNINWIGVYMQFNTSCIPQL